MGICLAELFRVIQTNKDNQCLCRWVSFIDAWKRVTALYSRQF